MNKSSYEPPKDRNNALAQLNFITTTKLLPLENFQTNNKFKMSLLKCKAITSLQNDHSVIIKEADKGGGVVIMNRVFYKEKILEMLAWG